MLKWNGGGNPTTLIMKKYKILQDTVANGSKVHAGDVVELDEVIGHSLCGYGKAEIHVEKPKAKAFYAEKASENWKDVENIKKVDVPWYRSIFE